MKKTILFAFFAFLLSHALFAQKSGEKANIGFSLFPKVTYQLSDDKDLGANQSDLNLSLYGDLFIDLRSKLQLKTGIGLHSYQFDQADFSPLFPCDNVNGAANPFGSFFLLETTAYFIGIPLEVRAFLSEKPNRFYVKAGFESLIGLWNKRTVYLYECGVRNEAFNEDSSEFFGKRYLFFAKLGIGYEFHVTENMKLYLEPLADYAFTNTFQDVNLRANYRIFNVGLLTGIRF